MKCSIYWLFKIVLAPWNLFISVFLLWIIFQTFVYAHVKSWSMSPVNCFQWSSLIQPIRSTNIGLFSLYFVVLLHLRTMASYCYCLVLLFLNRMLHIPPWLYWFLISPMCSQFSDFLYLTCQKCLAAICLFVCSVCRELDRYQYLLNFAILHLYNVLDVHHNLLYVIWGRWLITAILPNYLRVRLKKFVIEVDFMWRTSHFKVE